MRDLSVDIKVLTCRHFIRERYFMTTQEKQKKLSLRPLSPRDPKQSHRAATPLELLFDLIFVVAIAKLPDGIFCAMVGLDEFFMVCFGLR